MVSLSSYLILSAVLFSIGVVGFLHPAQHDRHLHVRRAHAQRSQPGVCGLLAFPQLDGRPSGRGLCHVGGRCRGRRRPGHHPGHVPHEEDGERGRDEFDEMVIPVAGCWFLVAGCSFLVPRCCLLAPGILSTDRPGRKPGKIKEKPVTSNR